MLEIRRLLRGTAVLGARPCPESLATATSSQREVEDQGGTCTTRRGVSRSQCFSPSLPEVGRGRLQLQGRRGMQPPSGPPCAQLAGLSPGRGSRRALAGQTQLAALHRRGRNFHSPHTWPSLLLGPFHSLTELPASRSRVWVLWYIVSVPPLGRREEGELLGSRGRGKGAGGEPCRMRRLGT